MSDSVIEAFKRLNMSTAQDSSDHEAVFEVSYQYLSKVKKFTDANSFHNCIVSLINSDRYYRALQLLGEVSEEIHSEFPVEKAYVYYKTGHFDKLQALFKETVTSGSSVSAISSRALKHVMAQAYYQNGHISAALALYVDLISSNSVDNKADIACNERAILSQLASKNVAVPKPQSAVASDEKTYDLIFNEALIELAGGNLTSSLNLLETASSMCLEQNLDSNPADLALEIAPIEMTIAYIHQISDNKKEALQILESMDLDGVTDLMTRLTFRNNYISLSETPQNVNFSARELNYKENLHHLRHKLTKPQYQILVNNNLLLSYQSGTLSKASSYLKSGFYTEYAKDFNGDATPLVYKVLVKLGISSRDLEAGAAKNVNRKLYKFCCDRLAGSAGSQFVDDETVAGALLLVHANAQTGEFDQAVPILEKIVASELTSEYVHASVFGTLINIYEVRGGYKSRAALEAFTQSLLEKFEALTPEKLAANRDLYAMVRAFALQHTAANSSVDVASILNLLAQAKPQDQILRSILDGDRSSLAPAEELASSKEIEELLAVKTEDLIPRRAAPRVSGSRKETDSYRVTKKTQKPKFSKTKVLTPASQFDTEKDLDKERWLPMKLRSYFKPSKRDLKKKSGGHQGAVESPAPVAAPPAASASASVSASASKSKSKNKKKKKGKK